MSNVKLRTNDKGNVIVPLLVGVAVVGVVLGIFLVAGKRNEEGKWELPGVSQGGQMGQEGEVQITVLPTQPVVAGKSKVFLEVTSPADGATIAQNKVTVAGKTLAGGEVSVNEVDLVAGGDGKFSTTISLEEGENPILITAGNEEGFEEKEITVYYEK